MRDLYELAPHVMPWAPTCPEPLMIQYLREATIEFCRRTRSWRTEEIYKLTAPEQDIQLVTCCDSIVHEIERVRYREDSASIWQQPLKPITFEEADDWQGGEATPVYFTQRIANTLRVGGYGTVDARVSWRFAPAWTLQANLVNAFDRDYATSAWYAQPGRELALSLRWQPN